MAKRDKHPPQEARKSTADYYKLNVRAVNDLLNADSPDAPPVSEEELRKYGVKTRRKAGDWVKAILLKTWFAGMVCFFFYWGLGIYVQNQLDQLFILGLALGFVTDLIVNPVFRFLAKTPGANDRWMMWPMKRYLSLPLNVLHGFVLLTLVVTTYNGLNAVLIPLTGAVDTIPLGVEPILFGLFTMGWDLLCIWLKHLFLKVVQDAKKSAGTQKKAP